MWEPWVPVSIGGSELGLKRKEGWYVKEDNLAYFIHFPKGRISTFRTVAVSHPEVIFLITSRGT